MSNKTRNERDKNIVVGGIFVFMAFITLLAILFPIITGGGAFRSSVNKNVVSIPRVTTTIASAKDGSVHSMDAKFSIELADKSKTNVSADTLQGKITDIVSTLDYDRINADGADEYIKSSIENGLGDYIDPSQIKGIYITEFRSGDAKVPLNDPEEGSKRNEAMRGLFQKME